MKRLGHLVVSVLRLRPGEEWRESGLSWVFLRLSRGAAYWLGPGENRLWAEGEAAIVPPWEPGVIRISQLGEALLHGFGLVPGLLAGLLTLEECGWFDPMDQPLRRRIEFLPADHPAAMRFAALAAGEADAYALAQRVEALGVVAALLQTQLHNVPFPEGGSASALYRFGETVGRMPEMELLGQPPEELANRCGCSLRHFNRLFRQKYGVSLRVQQTRLRLLKAQQLLSQSDEPVLRVAAQCGYNNPSLFCTLFKRRFGLTPSAWRKRAQAEGL